MRFGGQPNLRRVVLTRHHQRDTGNHHRSGHNIGHQARHDRDGHNIDDRAHHNIDHHHIDHHNIDDHARGRCRRRLRDRPDDA